MLPKIILRIKDLVTRLTTAEGKIETYHDELSGRVAVHDASISALTTGVQTLQTSKLGAHDTADAATALATARKLKVDLTNTTTDTVFDGTQNVQNIRISGVLGTANGGTGNSSGNIPGNAATATKLATARTIRTNLASTSALGFDGTGNIAPGVTGVLPTANGGTGNTSGNIPGNAATATKLATARNLGVNLARTTASSFDGNANQLDIPVKGILPVANGGTGNSSGNVPGNAATATKLATSRTIRTNLASTTAVGFDGTGNITPGITGVLPVANGGTGNSSGTAANGVDAYGSGYLQFKNGFQICWGSVGTTTQGTPVTYAKPFAAAPYLIMQTSSPDSRWAMSCTPYGINKSATGFTALTETVNGHRDYQAHYIAIGSRKS